MPAQTLQSWQNVVAGTATSETATNLSTATQVSETDLDEVEIWRFFLILLVLMVLAESLLGNRYLNTKTGSF
jgi:hypothetical protein